MFEEILANHNDLAEEARKKIQENLDRLKVRQESLKLKVRFRYIFKSIALRRCIFQIRKS